jgi:hypothetical protein
MGASDEILRSTENTLGGFSEYKKYRDAMIHARVLDAPTAIALTSGGRGKIEEVLLSVDALNGLYERLVLVRLELIEACNVVIRLYTQQRFQPLVRVIVGALGAAVYKIADLPKSQIEQETQDAMARYREHQKRSAISAAASKISGRTRKSCSDGTRTRPLGPLAQ